MPDPDSALTGLAAVVGSGGIIGIITAITSYVAAARKGKVDGDGESTVIHVGREMARGKWDEVAAGHLSTIAAAMVRVAAVQELHAEETFDGKDFGDRLSTKELRILRDMMVHEKEGRRS